METKVKKAVERYQCSGCISGCNIKCYEPTIPGDGDGCGKHFSGTTIIGIGKVFLGLPKGFNRLGHLHNMKPLIFKSFNDFTETGWSNYDKFNITVWKHLDEHGNTLVRGMIPRKNETFLHIFLENCIDKINCLEISQEDIEEMD